MPVLLQPGILVRSDEATVIYLLHVNEAQRGAARFVVQQLSPTALFVKAASLRLVQAVLRHRLQETVFDEEEEGAAGAGAGGGGGGGDQAPHA